MQHCTMSPSDGRGRTSGPCIPHYSGDLGPPRGHPIAFGPGRYRLTGEATYLGDYWQHHWLAHLDLALCPDPRRYLSDDRPDHGRHLERGHPHAQGPLGPDPGRFSGWPREAETISSRLGCPRPLLRARFFFGKKVVLIILLEIENTQEEPG